jgi:hypothetical protein
LYIGLKKAGNGKGMKTANKKLTCYIGADLKQDASAVLLMNDIYKLLNEQAKFIKG